MIGEKQAHRPRGGRRLFPEIEKFDNLPAPRAEGSSAYVSIMEGLQQVLHLLRRAVYAR
jgi:tRNA-2-methylthio-N6-dimethylallyladenosine synthase